MVDVNQANFETEVIEASHDVPVLVDFWAPWCGPCRVLGPILEKIERESAGRFKLVKVDSDENPTLSAAFGVRSIPCVVAFKVGKPVDRFVGALPEGRIRAFIDRLAPKPGENLLVQARNLLATGEHERAANALRTALALNPALDEVRAAYVRTLLRLDRLDDAALAFTPLAGKATSDLKLAALQVLLAASRVAREHSDEQSLRDALQAAPADSAARWRLAQWLIAAGRWQPAMDELLELVRRDRQFGDDAGRRGMLAVFELCEDAQLVRDYRRRLAAGLF
jgi:putative thioredoxin